MVSLSAIEQGQLPPGFETTKLYLESDVEDLKKEFASVKELGTGTMEEWLKGLPQRGREQLTQARKWEKWASSSGLRQVQTMTGPVQAYANSQSGTGPGVSSASGQPGKLRERLLHHQDGCSPNILLLATSQAATAPFFRQGRTKEEVEALMANRKLEIERRAALLDPPIPPDVLQHMSTFEAAVLISAPLDEKAWDILMPRLLAERLTVAETLTKISEATRSHEADNQNLSPDLPSHLEATLASTKAAKDAIDQHWEEVQAPLRAEIVRYVDEYIRDSWDSGDKVNKENCSRFAAETLVHIRKRFYDRVARDAAAAKSAGKKPVVDPPEGPFTQKLTLENMKWIFEYKIKPLTQPFKKEIFYCNGCPGKPFGFEGVNQHYAAKHTNALSSGNIVVHWRAEWPEVPPFQPEGRSRPVVPVPSLSATPHATPPSASIPSHAYNTNGYVPQPLPVAPSAGPSYAPGQPPGSTYLSYPYAGQYGQQYPGYQGPPTSYPSALPGIPSQSYAPQPPTTWGAAAHPPFNPYLNAQPPTNGSPVSHGYQQAMPAVPPQSVAVAPYSYPSGGYAPVPNYKFQLDSIVQDSREVWNATNNIKDLPGSVRVQTTIFHVVKRFRSKFSETPSLAMFQDGLSNNKDMRSLRHINALVCKACLLSLGNAPSIEKERDSYSLPQLVNHFQAKHVELMVQMAPNSPPLDWTTDMVSLPGHHVMAKLPSVVGSDVQKRKLFSDAFPEFFEPPAPILLAVPPPYGNGTQQGPVYQPQPSHNPDAHRPSSFDHHHGDFYGANLNPNLNPAVQAPVAYPQEEEQRHGYSTQDYVQAPAHSEHAAPNAAVSVAVAQDMPSHAENGRWSSQNARALKDVNGQQGNKPGKSRDGRTKGNNNGDASREQAKAAARNDRCHRCSKRGHYARDCPDNNAQKDIKVQVEVEEQRREEEIRAIWAADRANVARSETVKQQEAAPKSRAQSPPSGNKRSGNIRAAQQTDAMPSVRTRPTYLGTTHPPREESSLLDVLDMHLDQAERERPLNQGKPSNASRLSEVRRAPEAHQPTEKIQYEQSPRPEYQRSRSPGYQGRPEPAYRELPPAGNRRLIPADEYGYRHPDISRPEPESYDRRYREEGVVYDTVSPHDYRPFPRALPPTSRPTGQLYEIVEVEDEQGRYHIRRPIGFAPPPPRYDYEYEQEQPRYREAPVRYVGRPLHPEAEPYISRGPPDGYEPAYTRGPTHAPASELTYGRGRTPAPEPAYSHVQQGSVHGHHSQLPREEFPVAQARDSRNHEGRVLRRYEEEEEYDPRNPAVPSYTRGHRGGPHYG